MKNALFLFIFICSVFAHKIQAQVIFGLPIDSTFANFVDSTTYPTYIIPDTSSTHLWQLGITHKVSFTNDTTIGVHAIMTDTLHPYPANADNWFILKIDYLSFNQIVTIWHRYTTDSFHAGGLIEFSLDDGLTWQNVMGVCNKDGASIPAGTLTDNFYLPTDTLFNGQAAFNGNSDSTVASVIQFFCVLPKYAHLHSGVNCNFCGGPAMLLRFRFISDSFTSSKSGWLIDSISVRKDQFGISVKKINKTSPLAIYPNPSSDGFFNLPEIEKQESYKIEIFDLLGICVYQITYTNTLDLHILQNGFYFYKISNELYNYSGKLLINK